MYLVLYLFAFVPVLVASDIIPKNERQDRNLNTCNENGDCLVESKTCEGKCPCDMPYTYIEKTNECVIDFKTLMLSLEEKYNNEEKIRREAEKTFKGVLISALFVITCASVCVLVSCVYCCRINYTDRKLKDEVVALCKKMGKDKKLIPKPTTSTTIEPKAQSCNVVVEGSGVYCV